VQAEGNASGVLLVLTNCPDETTATRIRHELVEAHLAACVNQLGRVQSTYRWQGAVEEASEVTLLIKTTRQRYLALEARLRQLHPYSVPEILAIPIERGGSDYLAWVDAETRIGSSQTE
jgi:periplasmic divalent cation tolerance protein